MNICPRTGRHCEITGCNGNNPSCAVVFHKVEHIKPDLLNAMTAIRHNESDIVNEFSRLMQQKILSKGSPITAFDVMQIASQVKTQFGLP